MFKKGSKMRRVRMVTVAAARVRAWYRTRRSGGVLSPMINHKVTYPWGIRSSAYQIGRHTGEDYATQGKIGAPVFAVSRGIVVESSDTGGTWGEPYGSLIVVQMNNWRGVAYRYGYAHLSERWVQVDDEVDPGTALGAVGNTGNVSGSIGPHYGAHLHFEARKFPFKYGDDVDPMLVKAKP